MNMKEYIEEHYGNDASCYPFDDNDKYVFLYVFESIDDEEIQSHIISMKGKSDLQASEIFKQLMDNDKIDYFCYYTSGNEHHIQAYISNDDTLMAYKLLDDPQKAFDITIK